MNFKNLFKNKKQKVIAEQKMLNEQILKDIYHLGFVYEFEIKHWFRPGDIFVLYLENDKVISSLNGIQLSFEYNTNIYELSIPPKFETAFMDEICEFIQYEYDLLKINYEDYSYKFWRDISFKIKN